VPLKQVEVVLTNLPTIAPHLEERIKQEFRVKGKLVVVDGVSSVGSRPGAGR
jgi:hypothetical protein